MGAVSARLTRGRTEWTSARKALQDIPLSAVERRGRRMVNLELSMVVQDFAQGLKVVDSLKPQQEGRVGRIYQPGIGPLNEPSAVALVIEQLKSLHPERYKDAVVGLRYPDSSHQCDIGIGTIPEWALEVKLWRPYRDNGDIEDTAIKKLLSPYSSDRSAVADALKLSLSKFHWRKAVLIYGFEDQKGLRPLEDVIRAFELVAGNVLERNGQNLGTRRSAAFDGLVHPVHSAGGVFAWEISPSLIASAVKGQSITHTYEGEPV